MTWFPQLLLAALCPGPFTESKNEVNTHVQVLDLHATIGLSDQFQFSEQNTQHPLAPMPAQMKTQASQLEAARHQVSTLAAQLQANAEQTLDERRGGAAADQACRTAAAAQVGLHS